MRLGLGTFGDPVDPSVTVAAGSDSDSAMDEAIPRPAVVETPLMNSNSPTR